jgi:hypothetical protein
LMCDKLEYNDYGQKRQKSASIKWKEYKNLVRSTKNKNKFETFWKGKLALLFKFCTCVYHYHLHILLSKFIIH